MIEMAGILVLGIFAQWLAWRIRQPAILPLIIIGLLVGPISSLVSPDGSKFIDPSHIFPQEVMNHFISLSVGIILFEGGLTLKWDEIKKHFSAVANLLIIGMLITLIGGGLTAWLILDLDIRVAFLFGALIIVTGPTVIAPILRNVRPNKDIATILKWESILIDPIGALMAVLVFEFIIASNSPETFNLIDLFSFLINIVNGIIVGYVGAWTLRYLLVKDQIPDYLINVFTLAMVVFIFTIADMLKSETGLLAVTVMGMILGNFKLKQLKGILNFKESITVMLISVLFIILSANIEMSQLQLLGWKSLIVFLIVVFLLRPLGVFLSTVNSNLRLRDKIFISWIGPRGIVAAAIASIFSINLVDLNILGEENRWQAEMLIPLTFMIILGTVILQGSTAKLLARSLRVVKTDPKGFLIIGSNEASRLIAKYLKEHKIPVVIVDSSRSHYMEALSMDLPAINANILKDDISVELETEDIGYVLALTSSSDINIFACRIFRKQLGDNTSYRLITRNELKYDALMRPNYVLFGPNIDHVKLIETARHYPYIGEIPVRDEKHLKALLEKNAPNAIPLFLRTKDNRIKIIPANHNVKYEPGDVLVYLGSYEEEEGEIKISA